MYHRDAQIATTTPCHVDTLMTSLSRNRRGKRRSPADVQLVRRGGLSASSTVIRTLFHSDPSPGACVLAAPKTGSTVPPTVTGAIQHDPGYNSPIRHSAYSIRQSRVAWVDSVVMARPFDTSSMPGKHGEWRRDSTSL